MSAPGARSPPPEGIWRHARLKRHYRVAPEPTSLPQTTTDVLADRLLDFCLCLEPERARCFGPLDVSHHLPLVPNCVRQPTNAPHLHQTGTPSIPSPIVSNPSEFLSLFPFCELECLRTCIAQHIFGDGDVAASYVPGTHHRACWRSQPHYCQCAALCCRSPPVVTSTATIFHGPPITIVQSTATTFRTTFTVFPFPPVSTSTFPPPPPPPPPPSPPSTVFPLPPPDGPTSTPAPPRPTPPPTPTVSLPPLPPITLPSFPPISLPTLPPLPSASIPPLPLPTNSPPWPTGISFPQPPPSPSFPFPLPSPDPDPTATIAPTAGQPSPADPTVTVTIVASPPPGTPMSSQIAAPDRIPALGPAQIIGIVAGVLVLLGIAWGVLLYVRLAREQSRVVPKLRDGATVANPSWVRLTIRDMGEVNPFGSLYRRIERSGRRVGSVESGSGETQV